MCTEDFSHTGSQVTAEEEASAADAEVAKLRKRLVFAQKVIVRFVSPSSFAVRACFLLLFVVEGGLMCITFSSTDNWFYL